MNNIRIGFFTGPWENSTIAKDGANLAFEDIELSVLQLASSIKKENISLHPINPLIILEPEILSKQLKKLDILFCNIGPIASLIFGIREKENINIQLVREIHTLGWIGTIFQEYICNYFEKPNDSIIYASKYSANLWNFLRDENKYSKKHLSYVYQPLIASQPNKFQYFNKSKKNIKLAYLSRISYDKGFHHLPSIILKLLDFGWPISEIGIAGKIVDPVLFNNIQNKINNMKIKFCYYGQVHRNEAMNITKASDIILFPSTSSFEALGRVVVEALSLGKFVMASDFCGAHDLIKKEYLIPLKECNSSGNSINPFQISDLDINNWIPPQFNEIDNPLINSNSLLPYSHNSELLFELLFKDYAKENPIQYHKFNKEKIKFNFISQNANNLDPYYWHDQIHKKLIEIKPSRIELNNLAGVFKLLLINNNFLPNVIFSSRD